VDFKNAPRLVDAFSFEVIYEGIGDFHFDDIAFFEWLIAREEEISIDIIRSIPDAAEHVLPLLLPDD
jgi:hypothetical protein